MFGLRVDLQQGLDAGEARDGDQVVPPRPQRYDPALEAAAKHGRIDAIDQGTQPALAGNAVMEFRELPQKMQALRLRAVAQYSREAGARWLRTV
jgi:predicted TIM-barrel fold metal-dependent hydrolase